MRFLSLFAALFVFAVSPNVFAEPRVMPVQLHPRTMFSAYIVPDSGVRFTFPFVLDEQDSYIPFTLKMTNPAFVAERVPGRNYFTVTLKEGSPSGMMNKLFMNVAGSEITVEMRSTNDLSKEYSDVVFDLTKEDREQLIQQSIRQRTQALEQEYKKKFEELDALADQKSIARVGRLAVSKPSSRGVKEEAKLKLPGGDSIILYVDQVVNYDPYAIYLFDIESDSGSKGLTILDARLFAVDSETKQVKPVESSKDVPARVGPNSSVHGAITVLGSNLNPKNLLRLQVLTDKGTVEAEW